jgi:tape measure domain-containing protein
VAEQVGSIYYQVTADTAKLVAQEREVAASTARMAGSFNAITVAVKALAAAYALLKSAQVADEFRALEARVNVASRSLEEGAANFEKLRAVSVATRSALADNVAIFARLNPSLQQMGGNASDTLRIVDLLGKAITVSGASAAEKSSAMIQFGQALGSGKLAGDELRSLLENAPYLMKQLADGLGVPIGALKSLGEQGKLTADVVVNALGKAATQINADFARFPQTVGSSLTLAGDALTRLVAKIDESSGKSALLTGVIQGLSQAINRLTDIIGAANDKAGDLGRNTLIEKWAERTRTVLSYMADAADLVGRGFQIAGTAIGGTGAVLAALANRNFSGVREVLGAMDADIKRIATSSQLAGVQMRALFDAGAGGGRGFVNPTAAPSKLKAPSGEEKKKGATFDAAAYMAGLEKETAEGYERIDAIEREALRKNAQLLTEGKITRQQAAAAVTLIEQAAAQDRHALGEKELEDRIKLAADIAQMEIDAAKKLADERARGLIAAQDAAVAGDPVAQLQLELQRRQDVLTAFALADMDNAQLYADAKVALERETQRKIGEIEAKRIADQQAAQSAMLVNYATLFGNMADLAKNYGGKQDGLYRALFAASKAFAIADSIVKIQTGIANAASLPFPANIGAMASVAAATAGIISTIQGTNYGGARQYGGPTSAGSLYRVNETGRPEMFTAANGNQYMLPTQSGRVTAADQVGGAGGVRIVVNNYTGAQVTATASDDGRVVEIAVQQAEARIASGIANQEGPAWRALRNSTNIQPRL